MTERHQVYKCMKCGNIVMIIHGGAPALHCCGVGMTLMAEGSIDGSVEKHVPVIEKTSTGFKIKVGAVPHPMDETHHIEWIELIASDQSHICFLQPAQPAEAEFCVQADQVTARAYCNLHGHWKS